MTRQIKFRAWEIDWENNDKEQGRMIQWEDIRDDFAQILLKTSYFVSMQFTGLLDKNGEEIYEGDVVRVNDNNRGCRECEYNEEENIKNNLHIENCENYLCTQEVKWSCGYFCDEDTGEYCPPLSEDYLELEVIGNIYQNPELLTA